MNHRAWLIGMAALLGSGCSGETTDSFAPQTLTRVDEVGADGDCVQGGVSIATGVDDNQNGVLDDDEIDDAPRVVCAGDTIAEGEQVRRVDPLAPGDECPEGGVAIRTGTDDDGDGVLDDGEIDAGATQVVCNSAPVLTRVTTVPRGSAECPFGGRRIEAGLDNGDGEAAANDGELADGEVDSSFLDCNTTPGPAPDALTPPEGPAGAAVIDLRGAAAEDNQAGGGGTLSVDERQDVLCTPEVTTIFDTGAADASFEVPSVTIDLGDVPFEPELGLELPVYEYFDVHTEGEPYYSTAAQAVVFATADSYTVATGMRIREGITVSFPTSVTTLYFQNDVEIQGTLANIEGEATQLTIGCRNMVVGANGIIDTRQLQSPAGSVSVSTNGPLLFQGTLQAHGVNGIDGANVSFSSGARMVLTGRVDVSGGDAVDGYGGDAGSFRARTNIGGVWSSARILAEGGDGAWYGGAGGAVTLGPSEDDRGFGAPRDLRNSGIITAHAGKQANCPGSAPCNVGTAGSITLHAVDAALATSGALRANGGTSQLGGTDGGTIALRVLNGAGPRPAGIRLAVSGDLIARGGAGGVPGTPGGAGGRVLFQNCTGDASTAALLGYTRIELSGGAAMVEGTAGNGGSLEIRDSASPATAAARRLALNVPVNARGGSGYSAGSGGFASVDLSSYAEVPPLAPDLPALSINAALDLTGGQAGVGGGGYAGRADLRALGSIALDGSIRTSAGTTAGDDASYGGYVLLQSTLGYIDNAAALHTDGADNDAYDGGYGGCIIMDARKVQSSGALSAAGGDASQDTQRGGDGGTITFISYDAPANVTSTIDVSGGQGDPNGAAGQSGSDLPWCIG